MQAETFRSAPETVVRCLPVAAGRRHLVAQLLDAACGASAASAFPGQLGAGSIRSASDLSKSAM